jgi:hypothetical protein
MFNVTGYVIGLFNRFQRKTSQPPASFFESVGPDVIVLGVMREHENYTASHLYECLKEKHSVLPSWFTFGFLETLLIELTRTERVFCCKIGKGETLQVFYSKVSPGFSATRW